MKGTLPDSVRLVREPLDSTLTPTEVLRSAHGDPQPFALSGRWTGGTDLVGSDPLVVLEEGDDPFGALDLQPTVVGDVAAEAVGGGWIGYLGYQLATAVERLPAGGEAGPVTAPVAALGFYDHLVRYDRAEGRWIFEALWSPGQAARLSERLRVWRRRLTESPPARRAYRFGVFRPLPRTEVHLFAVARAIEHIRAGDTYQVNVCLGLQASFGGDPLQAWCDGVEALAPAYGAYLGYPGLGVASFSPELFLRSRGGEVLSSPIKGTSTADGGPGDLAASLKDRAENVMIVDLMRNDLGRVCATGTVGVPELCRVERHAGVWHLVSDVTGTLAADLANSDLLRATFPPGSVTGAPKVAAMELIAELEPLARGVYTGCIGIASPVSGLELSVAIRTFELSQTVAWLGVGGGVVADSGPSAELEECMTKAAPLVAAVGSRLEAPSTNGRRDRGGPPMQDKISVTETAGNQLSGPPWLQGGPDPAQGVFETLLVHSNKPVAAEAHIARLATSVARLYSTRLPATLGGEVAELASRCAGPHRLRITAVPVRDSGALRGAGLDVSLAVNAAPRAFAGLPGAPVTLIPAEVEGGLGEHKWQDRRVLVTLRQQLAPRTATQPDEGSQILLVDSDGSVLEAERASVFAVFGDLLCTPPADGRILAGTTREILLRVARAAGMRVSSPRLSLAALGTADEVFLASSVAGVLPVGRMGALDGSALPAEVGAGGGIRWGAPGPRTFELAALVWERWTARRPAGQLLRESGSPVRPGRVGAV